MTSKNEIVYSFSFVLFCDAGEILVKREKKIALQTANPSHVSVIFREQQKCKYQDFREKICFMMIYQSLFYFLYLSIIRHLIVNYFKYSNSQLSDQSERA